MENFDYLMHINKFAGRTYADLMQWPIFPFILSDYSSECLDLQSPNSFRDLCSPIGLCSKNEDQKREREELYRANYKTLASELQKSQEVTNQLGGIATGPYHYGSHYSNSGIVLHFLVRVNPYSALFCKWNDGNFDLPDRSFHSIAKTWDSGGSSTNFRELIPEFFFLPEMFVNEQRLNLGSKQNGKVVDDVELPNWAKNDPRLFVKIHRQAMEADYVSENLNHWIDLIFGFKQNGPAAVEALNVFHPATYYGFDIDTIQDDIQREARKAMIQTYGQTPKQLFDKPHPKKKKIRKISAAASAKASYDNSLQLSVLPSTPCDTCTGLRWGNIVGLVPHEKVFHEFSGQVALTSVSQDRVFGLKPGSVALIKFAHGLNGQMESIPSGVCIIHQDPITGMANAWMKKGQNPKALMPLTYGKDKVTAMASSPGQNSVWIGYESGRLLALHFEFESKTPSYCSVKSQSFLFGHEDAILDVHSSHEWSIAVTASRDGSSIIWDAKKATYVRTIRDSHNSQNAPAAHRLVRIFPTNGDIVVVNEDSDLILYSINGKQLKALRNVEPRITALALSSEADGVAVNVIATGHAKTGVIRLFSSWNLTPLADVDTGHPSSSMFSLEFTRDSKNLYVSFEDGFLVIFQRSQEEGTVSKRPSNYIDLSDMTTKLS